MSNSSVGPLGFEITSVDCTDIIVGGSKIIDYFSDWNYPLRGKWILNNEKRYYYKTLYVLDLLIEKLICFLRVKQLKIKGRSVGKKITIKVDFHPWNIIKYQDKVLNHDQNAKYKFRKHEKGDFVAKMKNGNRNFKILEDLSFSQSATIKINIIDFQNWFYFYFNFSNFRVVRAHAFFFLIRSEKSFKVGKVLNLYFLVISWIWWTEK